MLLPRMLSEDELLLPVGDGGVDEHLALASIIEPSGHILV
jgi:hypothetical protein